jgi:hypothetical protein
VQYHPATVTVTFSENNEDVAIKIWVEEKSTPFWRMRDKRRNV